MNFAACYSLVPRTNESSEIYIRKLPLAVTLKYIARPFLNFPKSVIIIRELARKCVHISWAVSLKIARSGLAGIGNYPATWIGTCQPGMFIAGVAAVGSGASTAPGSPLVLSASGGLLGGAKSDERGGIIKRE